MAHNLFTGTQRYNFYESLSGIETFECSPVGGKLSRYNFYESLSGIETQYDRVAAWGLEGKVTISTNPYQGLKLNHA